MAKNDEYAAERSVMAMRRRNIIVGCMMVVFFLLFGVTRNFLAFGENSGTSERATVYDGYKLDLTQRCLTSVLGGNSFDTQEASDLSEVFTDNNLNGDIGYGTDFYSNATSEDLISSEPSEEDVSDVSSAAPQACSCSDIAGSWDGSTTARICCTIDGASSCQPVSGSATVHINQKGCNINWLTGGYPRTGTIAGNDFEVSGVFMPPSDNVTFTTNRFTAEGTVSENTIELNGSGKASGTAYDESGHPHRFSCTGNDNSTLTTEAYSDLLANVGSGWCLQAKRFSQGPVILSNCYKGTDDRRQLFSVNRDMTIRIGNVLCLGKSSTNELVIKSCNGSNSQKWALDQNGYIGNCGGNYVTVKGQDQSAPVILLPKVVPGKTGSQRQQFAPIPPKTKVEQCFGGVGVKCVGIPIIAPAGPRQIDGMDGWQTLFVSVGSIAHDNCCLHNPKGFRCGEPQFGVPCLWESQDWTRPCMAEWVKACSNSKPLKPRHWQVRVPFGPYSVTHYTDNLRPSNEPRRQVGLPTESGDVVSEPLREAVRTRNLYAPALTILDPTDGAFCESGHYTEYEKYLICD